MAVEYYESINNQSDVPYYGEAADLAISVLKKQNADKDSIIQAQTATIRELQELLWFTANKHARKVSRLRTVIQMLKRERVQERIELSQGVLKGAGL